MQFDGKWSHAISKGWSNSAVAMRINDIIRYFYINLILFWMMHALKVIVRHNEPVPALFLCHSVAKPNMLLREISIRSNWDEIAPKKDLSTRIVFCVIFLDVKYFFLSQIFVFHTWVILWSVVIIIAIWRIVIIIWMIVAVLILIIAVVIWWTIIWIVWWTISTISVPNGSVCF